MPGAGHCDFREGTVEIARWVAGLTVRWGRQIAERHLERWDGQPIVGARLSMDDTGLVGVVDVFFSRRIEVDRASFGAAPQGHWREVTGTQRSANVRAEICWVARRLLQEGLAVIPDCFTASCRQLSWTQNERKPDSLRSVIQLEKQEEIVKRHGRSPDEADADVLALRETTAPAHRVSAGAPMVGVLLTNADAWARRRKRTRVF